MPPKTTRLLPLAIAAVASFVGPAPVARAQSNDVAAAGRDPSLTCTHDQIVPYPTDAEKDVRKRAFIARNEGTWTFGPYDVDRTVRRAERTGPLKGARLVNLDRMSVARTFIARNLDLLGLLPQELARGTFVLGSLSDPDGSIRFQSTYVVPGTEGYKQPVTRNANINMQIALDGTVYRLASYSSVGELSVSKLCKVPATKADDPLLLRNVIGHPLVYVKPEFVPTTPPLPLGNVEAKDVRAIEPTIVRVSEKDGVHYRIVYLVEVERRGYSFRFEVGALDGKAREIH